MKESKYNEMGKFVKEDIKKVNAKNNINRYAIAELSEVLNRGEFATIVYGNERAVVVIEMSKDLETGKLNVTPLTVDYGEFLVYHSKFNLDTPMSVVAIRLIHLLNHKEDIAIARKELDLIKVMDTLKQGMLSGKHIPSIGRKITPENSGKEVIIKGVNLKQSSFARAGITSLDSNGVGGHYLANPDFDGECTDKDVDIASAFTSGMGDMELSESTKFMEQLRDSSKQVHGELLSELMHPTKLEAGYQPDGLVSNVTGVSLEPQVKMKPEFLWTCHLDGSKPEVKQYISTVDRYVAEQILTRRFNRTYRKLGKDTGGVPTTERLKQHNHELEYLISENAKVTGKGIKFTAGIGEDIVPLVAYWNRNLNDFYVHFAEDYKGDLGFVYVMDENAINDDSDLVKKIKEVFYRVTAKDVMCDPSYKHPVRVIFMNHVNQGKSETDTMNLNILVGLNHEAMGDIITALNVKKFAKVIIGTMDTQVRLEIEYTPDRKDIVGKEVLERGHDAVIYCHSVVFEKPTFVESMIEVIRQSLKARFDH